MLFDLRDWIVHPSSTAERHHQHPEIGESTDWRLGTYRGEVADLFVCLTLGGLWDVTHVSDHTTPELSRFMDGLRARVDELLPDGKPLPRNNTLTIFIPDRTPRTNKV